MLRKLSIGCGGCLVLLVLAIGVLWYLGSGLPREYRVASQIAVSQSAEEVWLYVSDVEGWSSWIEGVDEVVVSTDSDGQERYTMRMAYEDIPFVVAESAAPTRFVTEIGGEDLSWGGIWTWELEPGSEGCAVRVTEDGWDDQPVRRFLGHHVFSQHGAIDMVLTGLSRALGEEQEPVHVE